MTRPHPMLPATSPSASEETPPAGAHERAQIHGLRVGTVATVTNLVLSPMSGVTDSAFRSLVRACSGSAVGLLVSEFIASEGLTRDNPRTRAMLRFKESERPISIQIFGADVERMTRAAVMVEEVGADVVDVNCGCPAPKVVKRGGGAELMRQPDRLREILRSIRNSVSIPMTVKIRAGWDDGSRNAMDIAKLAEDEGACMLAVHGRTRVQLYSGEADWELVGRIREALSIPVVGSGDVTSPAAALARLAGGYADGLMIGRAAIENPWIFAQTVARAQGRTPAAVGPDDRMRALAVLREGLLEAAGERAVLGRYRGLACRMVKGIPGGAAVRKAIGETSTLVAVDALVAECLAGAACGEGTLAEVA